MTATRIPIDHAAAHLKLLLDLTMSALVSAPDRRAEFDDAIRAVVKEYTPRAIIQSADHDTPPCVPVIGRAGDRDPGRHPGPVVRTNPETGRLLRLLE